MRAKIEPVIFAACVELTLLCLLPGLAWADPTFQNAPFSAAAANQKPQEVAEAVARFNAHDFDGALELLRRAASKDHDLPPARILMAELFVQSKQTGAAREALERAVIENPADPEAYILLGDMALGDKRSAEADLLYARADRSFDALKSSPKRQKALMPRLLAGRAGLAQLRQLLAGRDSVAQVRENGLAALKYLEAWTAVDPENAIARERLGRALFEQHRGEDALAQLRIAAKLDGKMLPPEVILAQLYEAAGDREHATHWMSTALRAAPKDLNTLLAAAMWSLETGQNDQAGELTARALAIDSKSLQANLLQGTLELLLKDYEAAEKHLHFVLQQSPGQTTALDNMALALCEQDDEAKKRRALEYVQMNIREHPDRAEAYATLGRVLYRFGHAEEAEKALRTAATHGEISPDAAYCLARIDLATKREAEGKQLLEAALKGRGLFMQRQEARGLLEQLNANGESKGK